MSCWDKVKSARGANNRIKLATVDWEGSGWHLMTVTLAFSHKFCSNLLNRFRVDVTHLSLYNLSVIHKKKYFDSEMHLMTYINDNWELLQLGEVRKKDSE